MIERYEGHEPSIDPSAWVHPDATVIGRVTLGAESSVWPRAVVRGDDNPITIGACTSIQDGAILHLTGGLSSTIVGDRVTVGHAAILHGCTIADDSLIGMGAILLDNCTIGRHVIVGAGSVIPMNKTIPDGVLVLGNPFRIVRDLTDQDVAWLEYSSRHYVEQKARYAKRDE